MDEIQEKLTTNLPINEFEDLCLKEFELAINISGAYNDLMYALEKVEREERNMGFFVKRVRSNVSKLMESDVNNV